MSRVADMRVTSHVGRDLLQSAAFFKTEAAVAWEYVANSLEYVERHICPRVVVNVATQERLMTISDNGRGMSETDLKRFFIMHAENIDRLRGRPGRGKFGTGKSAAFGIARSLRVDTVRDGLRNVVALTRAMIEASNGKDIPALWEVRNDKVDSPNGTTVEIADVVLERIRTQPIIEYIERHLQAFRARSPEVAVNSHVCSYREPEIEDLKVFRPNDAQAATLGDIELRVKIARAPLPEAEQGIAVTAGEGNLVAIERAGLDHKEFGAYLFGEVDVPTLETFDSPIEPFDSSRSLQLNPQHPVAVILIGFIGSKLELVRGELVRRAREAKRTEEARRLENEASRIADILNEDFVRLRDRLTDIRASAVAPGNAARRTGRPQDGGSDSDSWVQGRTEPGRVERRTGGQRTGEGTGRPAPDIALPGERNPEGDATVDRGGSGLPKKGSSRGGFRVDFRNMGAAEDRSRYDASILTILINLDNQVVKAALETGGPQDVAFRRLSYEIAFSEYAMALGHHVLQQDPSIPGDDLLYEVRSSLNRVAGSAAALYR